MQSKIDTLSTEVREKLDKAEQRIKNFNANVKVAGDKAVSDAKAMIASLEAKAEQQKNDIQKARAKVKDWAEHAKETTTQKIAEWKAKHEVSKLENRAKDADDYADSAIFVASAAIDEAERAIAEAIIAQVDLNAVKPGGTGQHA